MWSTVERKLMNFEKRYIQTLLGSDDNSDLDDIYVRVFHVDNAHTIRNTNYFGKRVHIASSMLINDEDGAKVDVILYLADDNNFGELEMNRLDTKPLLLKRHINNQ